MADAPARKDPNFVSSLVVADAGSVTFEDTIPVTGRELTNSKPVDVSIVDGSGDQITSFGGGTQYTEGDTPATITGTAALVEGAANALAVLTQPLTDTQLRATAVPVSLTSTTITGTVAVTQSGTWDEVGINDSGNVITTDGSGSAGTPAGGVLTVQGVTSMTPVQVGDNSTSLSVDWNGTQPVTGSGTATGALRVELPTNGTGVIATVGAVTAITNALPAGNNNIGDVDIASGTVTTVTTLTGGGIAHDSADSGNPHKVGYIAYSPDGTTPGTAVAELDRTNAKGSLDGQLFVNDEHPRWWSYHLNTSTAQTDASVQADPGDGFQIVITDIQFSNGAATAINMFLEEGASTIWGPVYLEAINGRGYVWKGKKHVTASTALTLTTSSSTAHSVEILGYIQAV